MHASPAAPELALPRVLLERLARPILARFLSTHAFPLADLAASDPRDRAPIHRLHALLHEDVSPPAPDAARA